jgi:hypothetical protein
MGEKTEYLSVFLLSVIHTYPKNSRLISFQMPSYFQTEKTFTSFNEKNSNFKAIFRKIFEFTSNYLSMREQLGHFTQSSVVNHIMKPKKTIPSKSFIANQVFILFNIKRNN